MLEPEDLDSGRGALALGSTRRMCNSWGWSGMERVRQRAEGGQREKGESSCDFSLPFPASPAMTIEARHICVS